MVAWFHRSLQFCFGGGVKLKIPNIESMKLEELEALEASINAEIQSRYYESLLWEL